jgi:membrane-bound ClpP family serine protease
MGGLLSNPNEALAVLFVGILLIYVECNRPGRVVPGCAGLLLALCGGYGMGRFPMQGLGVLLILLGLGALVAGIFLPVRLGWGILAAGLLSAGLYRLIQPFVSAHVHPATAIVVGVGFSAVTLWLSVIALTARRNKRVLGIADGFCTLEPHKVD